MGAGDQKDQAVIRSLEFSAAPQLSRKGLEEVDLVTHLCMKLP